MFIAFKYFRDSKWFQNHKQICEPYTKENAHKLKLDDCYVLIEDFDGD